MKIAGTLYSSSKVLAACGGGKTIVESDLGIKGAPDWVNKGTATLNDKDGRLFHGVGSSPALGDEALQRSTADDRARAEVARMLSTYLDVVSSDYSASAGAGGNANADQSVSRQIKAVTKQNLAGSVPGNDPGLVVAGLAAGVPRPSGTIEARGDRRRGPQPEPRAHQCQHLHPGSRARAHQFRQGRLRRDQAGAPGNPRRAQGPGPERARG